MFRHAAERAHAKAHSGVSVAELQKQATPEADNDPSRLEAGLLALRSFRQRREKAEALSDLAWAGILISAKDLLSPQPEANAFAIQVLDHAIAALLAPAAAPDATG